MNPIDNVKVNLQREDIANRYQRSYTYDEVISELIKIDSMDKKDIIRNLD